MAYWAAAQLQPQRDQLALHFLKLFGFETYAPRLRDRRVVRGCKMVKTPLLFPSYAFVLIELQWAKAQYSPGVARLVMDGVAPAIVPDAVVASLKARKDCARLRARNLYGQVKGSGLGLGAARGLLARMR